MTRTTDTTLRISAKNLASKDIRDVSKDIDGLAESQKKNATAADLAARSLKELRDEQRGLATVAAELSRRGGLADALVKQREEVTKTAQKIGELRRELHDLQATKASGTFLGDIDKAIRNVERSIQRTNNDLTRQTSQFEKINERAAKVGITYESSAGSIKQINAELARVTELQQAATTAIEQYHTAVVASREALQAQEQAQKEITAEAERRNAVEAAAAAQRRAEAAQRKSELEEQLRIRAELTKRFLAPQAAPAADTRAVLGPGTLGGQAAAREMQMRERLVNVLRRQQDQGEKLIASDGKLAAASRNVAQALNGEASSMDRTHQMGGLLADTGRKSLSVYQRLRGQILSLAASYVGLYQAANLVKSAISVDQERRKIRIQLETANGGDVQEAARDIKFLREQADKLGLTFESVAGNFANFKIAAKAVGASNATIKKSFAEATQVVTGLGLSGDDAEGVFRAFVQILGKARVQAEELRGQLGDRLPGAVAMFAKANGIALSDLDKHLKEGKGSVQEFLNFLHAYAQQTNAAVQQNSQSLFAQFNRLTNAWRDFLQEFAKAGVSKDVLNVVNQLIAKLKGDNGKKFAEELAGAFTLVGKAILFVIEHFDTFVALVKAYLALQLTKGFVNLGIEVLQTGYKVMKGVVAFENFTRAVLAARTAGTAMTLSMRGLSVLLGPVGIALAALVGIFWNLHSATVALDAKLKELDHTVDGLSNAKSTVELKIATDEANAKLDESAARVRHLRSLLADSGKIGMDGIKAGLSAAQEGIFTRGELERQITLELARQQALRMSLKTAQEKQVRLAKEEAAAAKADAAQQDNFVNPTSNDSEAEKAAAKAERLKQMRIDMEARAHEELLKMQEDFDQATVDKAVGTQEQIKANLDAQLSAISNSIARRKTELENLLNDAKRLNDPAAVGDINQAIGMLPQLQAELEAKARIKAATDGIALGEKKINDLISQRDAEIDIINTKVNVGLLDEVEGRTQVNDKMAEYKQRIVDAIVALEQQLEALKQSDPNLAAALHVDELIAKLEASKVKASEVSNNVALIGKNLGGQLAGGVANFFGTFIRGATGGIEGVHGIGQAFKYAMNQFREFLADFLVGIGQAILKAILLKAIMNAINGTSGGYVGAAMNAVGAATGHTGGMVGSKTIGSGNEFRRISASVFAGARRFHDGGLPGLRANEVPAILKKGEEVLTRNDPRNALNGGQGGMGAAPVVDLSIHNSIDSGSVVEAGLGTKAGQKAIYNHISANKAQYRQLLQN